SAPGWSTLGLRAPGYARVNREPDADSAPAPTVSLEPFAPRGLYLSVHGIGSKRLRDAALQTVRRNNLNALVVDVKGDRGHIPFAIDLALADAIGAQDLITVRDIDGLIAGLKSRGLYLIARIVVFKDELLAAAKPLWRVRTDSGADYVDNEGLRWIDPFRATAWGYTIAVASAAARVGFDEIQFDYVRVPGKPQDDVLPARHRAISHPGDQRLPPRGPRRAGAVQRLPVRRCFRLRVVERHRHGCRSENRADSRSCRRDFADALPVRFSLRNSRSP
ncbi:MAG: hypothetical protein DWQ08_08685, partial [Proteobacteria bacterium]